MLLRFFLAVIILLFCFQLFMDSARAGLSRFLSMLAIVQSNLAPADKAVQLSPNDPEAHYTRALALGNLERLEESVLELRTAIRLRPHHYYEWMDLGVTLDSLGDRVGAMNALTESIRLAPSFAQPHWQLGNLLYREGRYDDSFAELRFGARSNPNLIAGMLDLAWVAANGDVARFVDLIQPATARAHLEIARFLAKQGKGADSVQQIREAGPTRNDWERNVLYETISALLAAGDFAAALDAWAINHPKSGAGKDAISNGDFLEPIIPDEPGFGWQLRKTPNVITAIDPTGPNPGTQSFRIEFSGESAPATEVIFQPLLLSSKSRYSLSFLAKTEQLITGGPPVVVVMDAVAIPPKILGQSNPIPPGSNGWTPYAVEFSTGESGSAAMVKLQRLQCSQSPCPVFGRLWLTGFKLSRP